MNNNILITGCNGQLGTELQHLLPDAIFADINNLDITDFNAVNKFVSKHHIDTIINCAAYTAVDKAEDDVETADKVNHIGPKNLAQTGCRIIHISTDYVFDGTNHKPYLETDTANPLSIYGKTKFAGEQAIIQHASTFAIIRTAWLYSPHGSNFVKTMIRLGTERDSINVVADQIGSPTSATDLATAITKIVPLLNNQTSGIYHYTNEGVCSWYDFAQEIMTQSNLDCHVIPIPSSAYPTRASRPFYSVLSKEKIKNTFNISIPHWKESLQQCLKQF